jgi:phosphatidate cytidylyltransferase
MLLKRIISALILAPVTIAAIWYGSWAFYALMLAVFCIGIQEWSRLSMRQGRVHWGVLAVGIPYLAIACLAGVWLRNQEPDGLYMVFYVLFAIWACDIGAYAFGRIFKGPKMAPHLSPNKTWSGMIGGIICATFALIGYDTWMDTQLPGIQFLETLPWIVHGGLGALLALVGQTGDLLESAMKRKAEVKDSGTLIPGHGGLLDRVDALLLALPVFAAFLMVLEKLA